MLDTFLYPMLDTFFCKEAGMEHIKIGIIGAGETGTPLLARLFEAPFVQVVGVADLDLSQPGISLARGHGVMVTSDFMDLARLGENVDILIDVTGVPVVRESLRQYMQESGNDHTLIMHERIAILLMSLFAGRLVKGKHDELEYH